MTGREQVLWASMASAILISADALTAGDIPSPRNYLGLLIAAILMLFLSAPAPQIAGPLMILVFIGILIQRGPRTLRRLGRVG